MWKRVTERHGAQFVKHVVPAVVKPARVLWNEVIGFLFLSLGVIFGFKAGQLYMAFSSAEPGRGIRRSDASGAGRFLHRADAVVRRHLLLARPARFHGHERSGDRRARRIYPSPAGSTATCTAAASWSMRQYAGFGSARETNRRFRFLLSQGTSGLSMAFDLPTQMGYDSDHPMAAGEVGRVGVAISSLADMETVFEEIPLSGVSTSMTINSTAAILLACYALVARRQGADWRKLAGTVQNDILKEYIARGTYILSAAPRATPDHRHLFVGRPRAARVESDLDQRLSHPRSRGDRRAGTRVHVRQRDRVYRSRDRSWHAGGFVRTAPLVLLQLAPGLPRRDRQVPRRPPHLREPDARPLRRARAAVHDAALSRAEPRDRHSPRSSPTSTSCAPHYRQWPRSSAAHNRCTPIPADEAISLPTEDPRASRCGRSRSSRLRRARSTRSTR